MRQEEKNRKSRELILGYAFDEFAENGYTGSSLNQICARGSISKGLLYHYYANKDALYLACVGRLFQDMTAFLQARIGHCAAVLFGADGFLPAESCAQAAVL